MTKKATLTDVSSGYRQASTFNDNFDALNDKFDNTLSLDGSTPNAMNSNLDMNGYDIVNVATVNGEPSIFNTDYQEVLSEGAFVDGDKTKLDTIETGATADQSAGQIKTAYESNADTNAFTDAEQTKLTGIEASAVASNGTGHDMSLTAIGRWF